MIDNNHNAESDYWRLIYAAMTLAFVATGILLTFYPTLMSGFTQLQTDPGDSRLNNYILEHHWRWLNGFTLHASLWDPPFFYPTKNVLAYTDTLLSLAPIYWFWRVFGFEPEVSFALWMITLCVLNYLIALVLLKRAIRVDWLSANFGAFLISFGNSRIAQLGHQQLLSHAYTLLAIYALFKIFNDDSASGEPIRKRSWILVFFVCFAAQFYAGYYYGYFLFLTVLIAGIWGFALKRFRSKFSQVLRANRPVWLAGTIFAMVLLAPLAYHYLLVAHELGAWGPKTGSNGLARLASYFWMGGQNWLYGWTQNFWPFNSLPMAHEQQVGLGIVTLLVLFWFLWRYRHEDMVRMTVLVMATVFIAFTMFPGEIRLWRLWYYTLPGIQGIRVMARIGILLLIPAGIALSVLIDRNRGRPALLLIALLIGLLCCVEQVRGGFYTYDRALYHRRIELISEQIQPDCEAIFVSQVNTLSPAWPMQLDTMWASMLQGVPSVIGYSGRFPNCDAIHKPSIRTSEDIQRIKESLDKWCVQNGIDLSRLCWIQIQLPES